MKHLIETTNPSGLTITEYDRLILNSATNDVIVKGGGMNTLTSDFNPKYIEAEDEYTCPYDRYYGTAVRRVL